MTSTKPIRLCKLATVIIKYKNILAHENIEKNYMQGKEEEEYFIKPIMVPIAEQ
jgi:hypothetical protein